MDNFDYTSCSPRRSNFAINGTSKLTGGVIQVFPGCFCRCQSRKQRHLPRAETRERTALASRCISKEERNGRKFMARAFSFNRDNARPCANTVAKCQYGRQYDRFALQHFALRGARLIASVDN